MIKVQRKGGHVLLHYKKEDIIVSLSLDMFEARNLYDFLKDMVKNEGDPTVIDAVIKDRVEDAALDIFKKTGQVPSPADIVVAASEKQRNKVDQATRDFLLGDRQ